MHHEIKDSMEPRNLPKNNIVYGLLLKVHEIVRCYNVQQYKFDPDYAFLYRFLYTLVSTFNEIMESDSVKYRWEEIDPNK